MNLINWIFGVRLKDIFSGYRSLNRKVIHTLPVTSKGFEIETELTIQMLYNNLKIIEIPTTYRARPQGSVSKLSTFRDGFRVLWKLFSMARSAKPLTFFGIVSIVFFLLGLLSGYIPVFEFFRTGKITHIPLAILATALMIFSSGVLFLGITLHTLQTINWRFKEIHNVIVRNSIINSRTK